VVRKALRISSRSYPRVSRTRRIPSDTRPVESRRSQIGCARWNLSENGLRRERYDGRYVAIVIYGCAMKRPRRGITSARARNQEPVALISAAARDRIFAAPSRKILASTNRPAASSCCLFSHTLGRARSGQPENCLVLPKPFTIHASNFDQSALPCLSLRLEPPDGIPVGDVVRAALFRCRTVGSQCTR